MLKVLAVGKINVKRAGATADRHSGICHLPFGERILLDPIFASKDQRIACQGNGYLVGIGQGKAKGSRAVCCVCDNFIRGVGEETAQKALGFALAHRIGVTDQLLNTVLGFIKKRIGIAVLSGYEIISLPYRQTLL